MTWKARVEWVSYGAESQGISTILGVETLTNTGTTVSQTGPAPSFKYGRGSARITMLSGAALVAINDATPTEADSVRLALGQDPALFSLLPGQTLSFAEAADAPTAIGVSGGSGGTGGAVSTTATAISPTRTEGQTDAALSENLHGALRTVQTATDGSDLDFQSDIGDGAPDFHTQRVAVATNPQLAVLVTAAGAAQPAGENHVGKVGGESAVVTAANVRPADTTAYASGDLVANNTTAGSVTPLALAVARVNAGTGLIRRIRLSTTKTGLAGTEVFRVHFFKTSPTVANGDNGVFSVNGVAAVHLGYCDITLDRVFSDGSKGIGVPAVGSDILFDAAAGSPNIYALIEARGAYTPASGETMTLAVEVMRD